MEDTIEFIKTYLDLLNINKAHMPDLDFLSHLQATHIDTFSWNTIDLFLKRPIKLNPQEILDKFIFEQPGGVCYELNGAFCCLLNALGFNAHLISAYVYGHNDTVFNFEIDTHVIIVVTFAKEKYLVDVGWGDSYKTPILLENQSYFSDISGEYQLFLNNDNGKFQLDKLCNNEWKKQYDFSLEPSELNSFYQNLAIIYKDPIHHIHRQLNCVKPNKNGYIAIKNNEFTVKVYNRIEKHLLNHFDEIRTLLKERFLMKEAFVNHFRPDFPL